MAEFGVPNVLSSTVYRWRSSRGDLYKIWAEDGVVLVENQTDGEFHSFTRQEVVERFRALGDIAASYERESDGSSSSEANWQRDEARHQAGLVRCLRAAYRDATAQGDFFDPEVVRQRVAERRRNLQSRLIVPGSPRLIVPGE